MGRVMPTQTLRSRLVSTCSVPGTGGAPGAPRRTRPNTRSSRMHVLRAQSGDQVVTVQVHPATARHREMEGSGRPPEPQHRACCGVSSVTLSVLLPLRSWTDTSLKEGGGVESTRPTTHRQPGIQRAEQIQGEEETEQGRPAGKERVRARFSTSWGTGS